MIEMNDSELTVLHSRATYDSRYWGRDGAIEIALVMSQKLRERCQDEKAAMLLVSTYYSAAGAALALWKKDKKQVRYLVRAISHTLSSRQYALVILDNVLVEDLEVDGGIRFSRHILNSMSLSQVEVLMSPFWAIALKCARFPRLVTKDRMKAIFLGRHVMSRQVDKEVDARALVAGKLAQLTADKIERESLRFIVMQAVESKNNLPPETRARLYNLLGEHENARRVGEEYGISDVILKSS